MTRKLLLLCLSLILVFLVGCGSSIEHLSPGTSLPPSEKPVAPPITLPSSSEQEDTLTSSELEEELGAPAPSEEEVEEVREESGIKPPRIEGMVERDDSPMVMFSEFESSKEFRFYEPINYQKDPEGGNILKDQFLYEDLTRETNNLPNPTYAELMAFLAEDKTDEIDRMKVPTVVYTTGEPFTCADYAFTLRFKAHKANIRCAAVSLYFGPGKKGFPILSQIHAIVAFETTDRGLIHIEPQSDREVEVDHKGQVYTPFKLLEYNELLLVVYLW